MGIINHYFQNQSEQVKVFVGICVVLSLFFIYAGSYIKRQDPLTKPKRFMVILETYQSMLASLVDQMFKGRAGILKPYCTMLFLLLLVSNWISLIIPVMAPTTDYNVPLALVLISFAFKYIYEIKFNGIKEFFKAFTDPVPVMLPLNIMDIVAKPLSMSMRIFGNILSGTLILMVFMSAMGFVQNQIAHIGPMDADGTPMLNILGAVVAPPLHFYFDIFAGFIQAFVFTLLTLVFTALSLDFDNVVDDKKV